MVSWPALHVICAQGATQLAAEAKANWIVSEPAFSE
jgi:hypothetical protein